MKQTLYVSMVFIPWDRLEVKSPLQVDVAVDLTKLPGIGYLEVFDSLEKLQSEHPDSPWFEVAEKQNDT